MFRQLLEEAFEELRQTVAPARPDISFPKPPPESYRPLPTPPDAQESPTRAEAPAIPETSAPAKRTTLIVHTRRPSVVRAQLSSRSSLRSAFLMMEVLSPPVALRDPREGDPGR
jgi:hypothetical protein